MATLNVRKNGREWGPQYSLMTNAVTARSTADAAVRVSVWVEERGQAS